MDQRQNRKKISAEIPLSSSVVGMSNRRDPRNIVRTTATPASPLIVVPVYNHAASLPKVLSDLKVLKLPLLLVNDGSTDDIDAALALFPDVPVIAHPRNLGKGAAIASAMRYAAEQGYRAILTFDADGQHLAEDVPSLIAAYQQNPEALILGARDFASASSGDIPRSSKFGRSFSNFWIWIETGHDKRSTLLV